MLAATLDLNDRRRRLKMPLTALIRRSGVARPTVVRISRGNLESVRYGAVSRVASVLGVGFGVEPIDPEELRRQEARHKARLVARLTQGTMALEAQALTPESLAELEREMTERLLPGPSAKLWGD